MKLITISGLDGSGKSTQVTALKNYLASQDKRVFYFHAIQFGIAKKIQEFKNKYCLICRLTGKCETSNTEKSVVKANISQIILRRIFLLIDLFRFKQLKNKLLKENYDYILSDRYFYDSVINIYFLSNSTKKLPCEKFIIQPDLAIYLDANPQLIMSRDRKPEQGIGYLEKKKTLYAKKISDWKLKIIDGNRTKEIIFEELKKYV